jgi:hypothetical protein
MLSIALGYRGRLRQLVEVSIEACTQHSTLGSVGARAREHDEVPGWQRVSVSKGFASETLELVAVHGSSRSSA